MRHLALAVLGLMACAQARVAPETDGDRRVALAAPAWLPALDLCAAPEPNIHGQPPTAPYSECPTVVAPLPPASLVEALGGGALTASLSDGDGGWYLAGDFIQVRGVAVSGLAHVLATGEVDMRLRRGVDVDPASARFYKDRVHAMLRVGTTLYIAGEFFSLAGAARKHLAAFDVVTGVLLPWNPLPPPREGENAESCTFGGGRGYSTLATDGETIFTGGPCGLLVLDTSSGARVDAFSGLCFGNDFDLDATIHTVVVHGDTLCVDGYFDLVYAPTTCPKYVTRLGAATFDRRTGRLLP